MSANYLIASLPALDLETAPALTPEAFTDLCREQLASGDAEVAAALAAGRESDHPYARAWRNSETLLRNTVSRLRALRHRVDAAPYQRPADGCDLRLERAVEAAFQAPDPLQREQQLDAFRWRMAEELQGFDPMAIRTVLAYAVKLRIASLWAARTAAAGRGAVAALTDAPIDLNEHARPERA